MFALVENGVVVKHPYSVADLRRAHTEISFPKAPTDAQLAEWNVMRVFNATPPTVTDSSVLEEGTPVFTDGRWTQVWTVRDMTAEELADRALEVQRQIVSAVQVRLDAFARTRNYDGIMSACTYASDPNPTFAAEGQYCVNQRSATWAKCYEILAEVEAGIRPMPSGYGEIEIELPELIWPVV